MLRDAVPDALVQSLHPFVWGAVVNAFYDEYLERARYSLIHETLTMLIWGLHFASYYFIPGRSSDSWWLAIFLIALLPLQAVASEQSSRKLVRNKYHPLWQLAVEEWQPILMERGWELEYHHDGVVDGNSPGCWTPAPLVYIRFVPVSV